MLTRFDDDVLVSDAVMEHLDNRGDGVQWWAVLSRSNKNTHEVKGDSWVGRPYEAKRVFATDLCRALNEHVSHGGSWIVQWTSPKHQGGIMALTDWDYDIFHMVYLDVDGDPVFGVICDDRFSVVVREPPEKWLEDAEEAWCRAYETIRQVVDPLPRQQFKAAQGEPPPRQKPRPQPVKRQNAHTTFTIQ